MIDLFKAEWVSSVCVQVSRNGRTDQVWVQLFYYFVFDDSVLLVWVGFSGRGRLVLLFYCLNYS